MAGGVARGLPRHAVHDVGGMRRAVVAAAADRISGRAEPQRLGLIGRADGDRRGAVVLEELVRRCAEEDDGCDVVGDVRGIGLGTAAGEMPLVLPPR